MEFAPLVWVEIGRKIPRYLKANIRLHHQMYPSREQILITDKPAPISVRKVCKVIVIDNLDIETQRLLMVSSMRRTTKQIDFWINTSRRFFYLHEFMVKSGTKKLIHSESDNVILQLEVIDNYFKQNDWGVAYSLQADEIGCASILMVNGEKTLEEFNRHIVDSWREIDQDDMKLLGTFSKHPKVRLLPVLGKEDFLFDAGTYGRFLLGTEARNLRLPFSRRGLIDSKKGAIDVWKEKLKFSFDKSQKKILISSKFQVSQLVNIHIHSKRIPKNSKKFWSIIRKDIKNIGRKKWFFGHLDFGVLLERLVSWFTRRIMRKDIDFRLR